MAVGHAISRGRGERGVALVAVIWGVALLAIFAGAFSLSVKIGARQQAVALGLAQAEAAADAGVMLAIADLVTQVHAALTGEAQTRPSVFARDGRPFVCRFADTSLWISVQDEGGRIDLNAAPAELFQRLFEGLGLPEPRASALAQAVVDFRDPDDTAAAGGSEAETYRQAGPAYGPKNAAFEAVEEVAQVLGVDDDIYAKAVPYLTVHSGRAGLDPSVMSAALKSLLATSAPPSGEPGLPSTGRLFHILAEARSAGGPAFRRSATVEIKPELPQRYLLREWSRGDGDPTSSSATPMTPCP